MGSKIVTKWHVTVQVRDEDDLTIAVTTHMINSSLPSSVVSNGIRELLRDVAYKANAAMTQIVEGLEMAHDNDIQRRGPL
jgi:hypothetical protein